MKILILCTGNSCRSQMAEAFLRSFDSSVEVFSAGTEPAPEIHPLTIQVMQERNIDLTGKTPEPVDKYLTQSFDYVITVCDEAREKCPVFTGKVKKRFHMGFEDPAQYQGSEEEKIEEFRRIRDLIEKEFKKFYLQAVEKSR